MKKQGDVEWYMPNRKKPFAYSTKAESDMIKCLLEKYGDLRLIPLLDLILPPNVRYIIKTFINEGVDKPKLR